VIERDFAQRFAADWIDAWNAHDLERILSHYAEDFEMSSPVIAQLMGEATGLLRGKAAIRDYWRKALDRNPALRFELVNVFVGSGSVTLTYRGHRGLSAEVFCFDAAGMVYRAAAHYALAP
jgi:ketosteroid isomerase-like protein